MDFLTNHYKHKCEVLQEQIKILEQKYKKLLESEAPASVFRGTGKGQQAFGDQELEAQMRRFKKGGLFQQVKDEDQTQEYKDAKAELERRRASKQTSNTTSIAKASPTTAAPKSEIPSLLQRVPGQPDAGWNRPRTTPMPPNQPPHPMDLSKSSKPRKTTQSANRPPNLIARDPNMPMVAGVDVEGPPTPISQPKPQVRSGPNSPDINADRASLVSGMVQDTLKGAGKKDNFDTSLSLGRPQQPEQQKSSYNFNASSQDLLNRTQNLLGSMNRNQQTSTPLQSAPETEEVRAASQKAERARNAANVQANMDAQSGRGMGYAESDSARESRLAAQAAERERNAARVKADLEARETRGMPKAAPEESMADRRSRLANQAAERQRNAARVRSDLEARETRGMPKAQPTQSAAMTKQEQLQSIARNFTQADARANTPSEKSADAMARYRQEEQEMLRRGINKA